MNGLLLQALDRACAQARPVVLARSLEEGPQYLVDQFGAEAFGEQDDRSNSEVPEALLQACRDALARDDAWALEIGDRRYLIQTIAPPPRLVVIGAVHIAQKLIPMAIVAGYRVQLLDPREAFASEERFPDVEIINDWPQEIMASLRLDARTAVVTLSRDSKIDEPALKCALESEAFYIGALGSKRTHAKRLTRLRSLGFDAQTLARICGPVGLPLGGRSPAEIAVAILAQMTRVRYSRIG